MEDHISDDVIAQYKRMQDAMIPYLLQHSVAIVAYYDGEIRQYATGTLMRFSDRFFLVTAALALENYHQGKEVYSDLQLFVDNGNAGGLVPVYGSYQATQIVRDSDVPVIRLAGERSDIWDIGIWDLHPKTVNSLTAKRFLNRRSVSITADLTGGVYFLAGCPCEWSRANVASQTINFKWIRYITQPYPEREQLQHFDSRFHVALSLSEDPQLPKKLQGISGCAIWKLSNVPVNKDWTIDEARVVAVQTCVDSTGTHKAIRGTKWRYVLSVLAEMCPEIREGFNLWLPGQE